MSNLLDSVFWVHKYSLKGQQEVDSGNFNREVDLLNQLGLLESCLPSPCSLGEFGFCFFEGDCISLDLETNPTSCTCQLSSHLSYPKEIPRRRRVGPSL